MFNKDFENFKRHYPTLLKAINEAAELYCLEEKKRVWKEACEAQLALIAKTFRENKHRGSFNDQPVFQAIAETIQNHPLSEFKP